MQNVFGTRGAGRRGQWIDRRTLPEPPPGYPGPTRTAGAVSADRTPVSPGPPARRRPIRARRAVPRWVRRTLHHREARIRTRSESRTARTPTGADSGAACAPPPGARAGPAPRGATVLPGCLPLSLSQRPSYGRLADRNQRGAARPGAGQRRLQRKSLLLLKQGDVTLVAGDAAQRPRPGSTTLTGDDIEPQCGCQSRSKHAHR